MNPQSTPYGAPPEELLTWPVETRAISLRLDDYDNAVFAEAGGLLDIATVAMLRGEHVDHMRLFRGKTRLEPEYSLSSLATEITARSPDFNENIRAVDRAMASVECDQAPTDVLASSNHGRPSAAVISIIRDRLARIVGRDPHAADALGYWNGVYASDAPGQYPVRAYETAAVRAQRFAKHVLAQHCGFSEWLRIVDGLDQAARVAGGIGSVLLRLAIYTRLGTYDAIEANRGEFRATISGESVTVYYGPGLYGGMREFTPTSPKE